MLRVVAVILRGVFQVIHVQDITERMEQIRQLLGEKLGIRGGDLAEALRKGQHRLPRQLYKAGQNLVDAQPVLNHPKLALTVEKDALHKSADALQEFLEQIDLSDRRKGFLLSMVGGMVFNLLVLFGLVIWFLVWRGLL